MTEAIVFEDTTIPTEPWKKDWVRSDGASMRYQSGWLWRRRVTK